MSIPKTYDEDIKMQLSKIDFKNKEILDIGTRNGLNCITMKNLGSKKVIGIDINDSRFNELNEDIKLKNNIQLIKIDLLDYEIDDSNKFNIITCFLWNMPLFLYDKIIKKILLLLKSNGTFYVGIHDDLYKYDKHGGSVIILLGKYFKNIKILDKENSFQWIIEASN